jgi:hypothetical protein
MANLFSQFYIFEDKSFVADSDYTFNYEFTDSNGVTPFDLTGATVTLLLCPFGQSENNVLQKTGTITNAGQGECKVDLVPFDTHGFSGWYIQQPVIVKAGKTYRPGQGRVLISPAITMSGG